MDKTTTSTLTQSEIDELVQAETVITEAEEALERRIGTAKCYGTFNIVRPDFSAKANRNVEFTKRSA